jgi:hypothetical protein
MCQLHAVTSSAHARHIAHARRSLESSLIQWHLPTYALLLFEHKDSPAVAARDAQAVINVRVELPAADLVGQLEGGALRLRQHVRDARREALCVLEQRRQQLVERRDVNGLAHDADGGGQLQGLQQLGRLDDALVDRELQSAYAQGGAAAQGGAVGASGRARRQQDRMHACACDTMAPACPEE